jgi:hypothetical protein
VIDEMQMTFEELLLTAWATQSAQFHAAPKSDELESEMNLQKTTVNEGDAR